MDKFSYSLNTAPATKILQKLAEAPYDLTSQGALSKNDRLQRYVCITGPFRLHYAMQRVDDRVLSALQELADQCDLVEQFRSMRRGAVLNKINGIDSEERQVLHTACRDLLSAAPAAPEATGQAQQELLKLKSFLQEVESGAVANEYGERFTTLVNIGIGGSDLGPRSVYEALRPYTMPGRSVEFIANVDPDDAAGVLCRVDLRHCLINIVSKSGTTLETLTNEQLVMSKLKAEGLRPEKHCIAVTGKDSPMDDPDKYMCSFYIYDYIGGRYSTSSMVGGVPLGFAFGFDAFMQFLEGAAEVDSACESEDILANGALMLALLGVWNHNFLGASSLAILPYCQTLHRFPAHLQQCDMESNGKGVDRQGHFVEHKTGPVIWGEPGTNGQHAFYQLLHQGTEIVPVEFIGFECNQHATDLEVEGTTSRQKLLANLFAQSLALATGQYSDNPNRVFEGNRPSVILLAHQLTPKVMGALLAFYEAKIVFQGFTWNINSFDQEGVQLGKVLANRILECMRGENRRDGALETQFLESVMSGGNNRNVR